ncbi:MAG: Zn-ribbon domain-containing OB-fold protein [Candidatus Verstraetearchaeota archaeon]|nr:Zn-ribbon domain-containing OB-fold protein [Candidatus Verstraetearchaeota archaeon]
MSVPRYWREIPERSRLEASKCATCGNVIYPNRARCAKCGSDSIEPYRLPERGKLLTFTVVRNPPRGFEKMAPFVLGIIELEDGSRLMTQITDVMPGEVTIGMPLEAVLRKVSEDGDSGIIEYAIKFRPTF